MIPEMYKDRSHALIKHKLLKGYLEKLFMIIGQHQDTIWYVDCFAGPWQIEEDDTELKGTSISISIDIMKGCQKALQERFNRKVTFKAVYIEKDTAAYTRLENYLKSVNNPDIETFPLKGDFFDLRTKILEIIGQKEFAFFFIDPTGWKDKVEMPTLKPLLQRKNCEFIINFMYDFINRTYFADSSKEDTIAMFGSEPKDCDLPPKERELFLINQYTNHLKSANIDGNKIRTAYATVLDPIKDRTKYHLVYITRHPLGIVKFFEESEKVDIIQNNVRAQTKQERRIEKSQQPELFPSNEYVQESEKPYSLKDIKEYWLSTLKEKPIQFGIEKLAEILEEKGWFVKEIQKAFKQLEKDGMVKNQDAKHPRPTKPIHFKDNEHLVRIK